MDIDGKIEGTIQITTKSAIAERMSDHHLKGYRFMVMGAKEAPFPYTVYTDKSFNKIEPVPDLENVFRTSQSHLIYMHISNLVDKADSSLMRNAVKVTPLKIVPLNSPYADVEADKILKAAIGNLEHVVIAGQDKDGNEYFCSSMADGADAIWYLERCKLKLLTAPDPNEDED